MATYDIVPYRPELEPGIIELRHLSWSNDPSAPARFLDWKYRQNPYLKEIVMMVALCDGQVVGMRGVYGTCWQADGAPRVIIPAADDFAIVPEHRNSGVATLIMRAAFDDFKARGYGYVMALSAGRMTALASIAAGWKSGGAMEPVARFDLPHRIVNSSRERLGRTRLLWRLVKPQDSIEPSSSQPFERLDAFGRTAGREAGTTISFERTVRADAMAGLIARIGHDGRIRQVRDAEFLAWRYQNPAREYAFLYFERDGQLEGFLALGRFPFHRTPMLAFHVVDMEGTKPSIREELLMAAVKHGRFPELGAWNAAVAVEDRALLARAGFTPVEMASRARGLPCVLVRAIGPAPAAEWRIGNRSLIDPASWDMRLLYSMHG